MNLRGLKEGHWYKLTFNDGTTELCRILSYESEADSPDGIEGVFVEIENVELEGGEIEVLANEVTAAELAR